MRKSVFIMITLIFISISLYSGGVKTVNVSARVNTIDQAKRGNIPYTKLDKRTKYKVVISGSAYFGSQKVQGCFVYFSMNKEDGNAERYLFVKQGDSFYINTGESHPFILGFILKFGGNRNTFRGGFKITCIPVGVATPSFNYNEDDMYRGIRR
jgi:hypothetical protein